MPRRFRRLRECILEDLQLFGFDGGARSAPLGSSSAFVRRFRLGRVVTAALALSVPINRAYTFVIIEVSAGKRGTKMFCTFGIVAVLVVDGGGRSRRPLRFDDNATHVIG